MIYLKRDLILVRSIQLSDAIIFEEEFAKQGWERSKEQFETYYQEQEDGIKQVFVAEYGNEVAGYVTLKPEAPMGPYAGMGVPEIVDFNVLERFQKKGIGKAILDVAEQEAKKQADTVCLGVGLHPGYGSAQRMYIKRGYIPDGSGLWYQERQLKQGEACFNDDDMALFMSKKL